MSRTPLINGSQHSYLSLSENDNSSSNNIESFISYHHDHDDGQSNSYKEINKNLTIVRDVIRNLVPLGTLKYAENLVIDPVVDYVFEKCKNDPNVVFVVLYYARGLQEMIKFDGDGGGGPAVKSMRNKRIECSELLARELVHKFQDQELLFTKVLTKRYAFSQYDDCEIRKNALYLATRLYSDVGDYGTLFLSDDEVQACVYALWTGHLMPDRSTMDYHIPRHNSRFLQNFKNLDLLSIPRNKYLIDVFAYIMLLIIYTLYAANYDELHGFNDYFEGSMYFLVFSFILNDIRLIRKYGIKHFFYFRKILSFIIYIIFIIDFELKIRRFVSPDRSLVHRKLLSLVPLFLHWRVLLLLDAFQPIGRWLTQISRILKKSMSYYILLSLSFIAFFQSFLVLQTSHEHHDDDKHIGNRNEWGIFKLLVKGILNSPDFTTSLKLEDRWGFLLYTAYVFIVSVILFAVLLPLFMTALATRRSVPEEYLSHFAYIVLREIRDSQTTRYIYPPPFNLLYYILVLPIRCFFRQNQYGKIENWLTRIIFVIPMIFFALIQTNFGKNNQDKEVRDLDVSELPDLPIPKDEKQMLRGILKGLDEIQERQSKMQSRLEAIESHLGDKF